MTSQLATESAPAAHSVLSVRGAVKRFPGVVALREATFDVHTGEVHALVGENGAGKSTLIKLMSGIYDPDEGEVAIDGVALRARPRAAHQAGVATIHQDHQLIPYMSLAENILLGRWPAGRLGTSRRRTIARAQSAADRVLPGIDLTLLARQVGPGERQLTEVARALSEDARFVIMDEPTASLSSTEVARLFGIINELRNDGIGVVFVAHSLDEVFTIADRITVLRDGAVVASRRRSEFTPAEVVRLMVGDDVDEQRPPRPAAGEEILRVAHLTSKGRFSDISFSVRAGEVVTIGGLVGAGRTELVRAIFGADSYDGGEISIDGERLHRGVDWAIAAGIGFVPEDRRHQGIVPLLSVRENLTLSVMQTIFPRGILASARERRIAQEQTKALRVRAASMEVPAGTLSGGNQQKLLIGRWLAREPRLLILDEPTKGIDVGAKAEIHRLIWQLADRGVGVLVVTSDLDELLLLSDRALIMRAGRVVGELVGGEISRRAVIGYATGGGRDDVVLGNGVLS